MMWDINYLMFYLMIAMFCFETASSLKILLYSLYLDDGSFMKNY